MVNKAKANVVSSFRKLWSWIAQSEYEPWCIRCYFILAKIKNTNSFELDDWIQVVGDYQLHFDYSALGQEALQKVFQIFSECSALNPDEDVPEHEQNFLDSEFITADNIDDEGRVHFNNQEDGEEDGEEYEDEDEDENEDNNDQDKIQEEEEGPK